MFNLASQGEDATMGAGIPEELENAPYSNLSEVFAAIPDITKGRFPRFSASRTAGVGVEARRLRHPQHTGQLEEADNAWRQPIPNAILERRNHDE